MTTFFMLMEAMRRIALSNFKRAIHWNTGFRFRLLVLRFSHYRCGLVEPVSRCLPYFRDDADEGLRPEFQRH